MEAALGGLYSDGRTPVCGLSQNGIYFIDRAAQKDGLKPSEQPSGVVEESAPRMDVLYPSLEVDAGRVFDHRFVLHRTTETCCRCSAGSFRHYSVVADCVEGEEACDPHPYRIGSIDAQLFVPGQYRVRLLHQKEEDSSPVEFSR